MAEDLYFHPLQVTVLAIIYQP